MQRVVGAQGPVHVSGADGGGEPLVGGAHRLDVRGTQPGHGDPRHELVHGADHGGGVPDVGGHERGHPGVALRLALQQPLVHEPGERLATGARDSPSRSASSASRTTAPGSISPATMASRIASYARSLSRSARAERPP
ncbi:hypothetical protein SVIOM74S_03910 [Streptomyces violarus]